MKPIAFVKIVTLSFLLFSCSSQVTKSVTSKSSTSEDSTVKHSHAVPKSTAAKTFNNKKIDNNRGSAEKPNIVMIAVDDLNIYHQVLGNSKNNFLKIIYPDNTIRQSVLKRLSPNLQRLAEMSLTFNHAYSAAPLCGPSRTALFTGLPPHVSNYYAHDKHFRHTKELSKLITLPQQFKNHGYFTSGVGKVFHKGRAYWDRGIFSDWPDSIFSWSHWVHAINGSGSKKSSKKGMETISKYWPKGAEFTRFGVTKVPHKQSYDYINAKHIANLIQYGRSEIIDFRNQKQIVELPPNKPYFLAAGMFAPHLPFVAEQKYFDLFPKDEMNITRESRQWVLDSLKTLSKSGKDKANEGYFQKILDLGSKLDGEDGDLNAWRALLQAYLATLAYADRNIGVLIDAIEANAQKDNTIIIFWSDHGMHMGDKNREGKTTLWEAVNQCNLMILDPRKKATHAGKRANTPVSLQDIYPTLTSLAGIPTPKLVYGYDLSPVIKNPKGERGDVVLNTNGKNNHAIRSDNYRYIRYKNGDQELFNLDRDPFELNNLALSQNYQNKLKEFSSALDRVLAKRAQDYR